MNITIDNIHANEEIIAKREMALLPLMVDALMLKTQYIKMVNTSASQI